MNKFLSFLKTAEQKVAGVLKGAAKEEPAAAAIADTVAFAVGAPEVVPFINKIGSILVGSGAVVTAIQGTEGSGVAKLAVAAPMVDQLFKTSGFLNDKEIADEAKWNAAIQSIAGSFADLMNSVQEKSVAPAAQ